MNTPSKKQDLKCPTCGGKAGVEMRHIGGHGNCPHIVCPDRHCEFTGQRLAENAGATELRKAA